MTPRPTLLFLLVLLLGDARAAEAARGDAASGRPSSAELQAMRFEREILAAQLDLAKNGAPYFRVSPWAGEMDLLVGGVVVSRFPAEKCLVGRDLRRILQKKDPQSAIARPFKWAGLDRAEEGGAAASLNLRLEPSLRIVLEGSPSNFFWRWVRFQIENLPGLGRPGAGMTLVLFYHPDSLATLTPLLDDSLAVLVSPYASEGLGGSSAR